jgi:hypothetical protein
MRRFDAKETRWRRQTGPEKRTIRNKRKGGMNAALSISGHTNPSQTLPNQA